MCEHRPADCLSIDDGRKWRSLRRTVQACAFCVSRNAEGNLCFLRHDGYFYCVPQRHQEMWREALQKATGVQIPDEMWVKWLSVSNLRVELSHIVRNSQDRFDAKHPHLIAGGTGRGTLPSAQIATLSAYRSQQRALALARERSELLRKGEEASKAAHRYFAQAGELLGKKDEGGSEVVETSKQPPASGTETPQRWSTIEVGAHGGFRFSAEVRELVCYFAALGVSFRNIPSALRKVLRSEHGSNDPEEEALPSHSSIGNIVREGGVVSTLEAVTRLHRHGVASTVLGQDGGSSRGRSLLVMTANTPLVEGEPNAAGSFHLATIQLVNKTARVQAASITEKVHDMARVAKGIPETASAGAAMGLTMFAGTMGDHAPVNGQIHRLLSESRSEATNSLVLSSEEMERLRNFPQLGCVLHQSDLLEKAGMARMSGRRPDQDPESESVTEKENADCGTEAAPQSNCPSSEDRIAAERLVEESGASSGESFLLHVDEPVNDSGQSIGMDAATFIYKLSHWVGVHERGRHFVDFAGWLQVNKHISPAECRLKLVNTSRLHVHSYNARLIIQQFELFREYLNVLQQEHQTWTSSYLLRCMKSERCVGELRALAMWSVLAMRSPSLAPSLEFKCITAPHCNNEFCPCCRNGSKRARRQWTTFGISSSNIARRRQSNNFCSSCERKRGTIFWNCASLGRGMWSSCGKR